MKEASPGLKSRLMWTWTTIILAGFLTGCGVTERVVIRAVPQAHVTIPKRDPLPSVERTRLWPGTTISHPKGPSFTVGPSGGTYLGPVGTEQVRVTNEIWKHWSEGVESQVQAYNKRVDENNSKAKDAVKPEDPKLSWWRW